MRRLVVVFLLAGTATLAVAQPAREDAILDWEARLMATPKPKAKPSPSPAPTAGAEAEIDAARALLAARETQRARARFQDAIEKDPTNAKVQEFAAHLGDTREGIAREERALQREDAAQALEGVGWLTFFLGPLLRLDLTWALGLTLTAFVAVVGILSLRARR